MSPHNAPREKIKVMGNSYDHPLLRVKKYKTPFWMSYCLLQSCPEYTDPTVVSDRLQKLAVFTFGYD